jgi:hypothetical protein
MRMFVVCLAVGCGPSTSPAPEHPATTPVPVAVVDAAVPDAGPPDEVLNAPAWIFRFNTPGRLETWTLRSSGTIAMLVVETAQGTTRYLGTMTDGALAVTAGSAKMALDCKKDKLAVSAKCNDTKANKIDVLDCFHPDFKSPMTFAPAPGVEYAANATCTGYRLITN